MLRVLGEADWLNEPRLRRWGMALAAACLFLWGLDVWTHTRAGVTNAAGEQLGRDFINYWSGARLAAEGRAALAYDFGAFLAWERAHTAPNAEFKWYGYPPVNMLLTLPLAAMPFAPALFAWLAAGTTACWALLARLTDRTAAGLALLAAPAAYLNAVAGQNGLWVAALLGGGLMALPRRPLLAGVLFGLLCFKPHLGLLIPVALMAGGRWRAFAAAAGTVIGLALGSWLLLGPEAWAGFLRNAPFHRELLETNETLWPRMPGVFTAVRMAGGEPAAGYALQAVSTLLAAAGVFWIWRRPGSQDVKNAVLVVGAFLATPYAWDYDLVVLVFAAAWLAREAGRTGWRPWEKTALLATVLSPAATGFIAVNTGVHLAPILLWAVMGMLLRRALPERAGEPAAVTARA